MRSDMGKIKRISAAFLLFCVPLFAMASSSLHDLDRLCGPGQTVRVKGSVIVEGIVISSYKSENMAVIPNLTPASLDLNANLRTAYIQSPDGSKGLRIIFDEPEYNMLDRYDNVVLDLGNCLLGRDAHTGALTVSGLTPSNVSRVRKGTAGQLPLKARYVCELTDDDIYTYVTLKDMEFVFKDGSFADVRENYIKDRMDSWVSQIRDSRGGSMYLHVNMKCDWRRRGDGVPAGCGDICGIIVNDQLRRHGDSLGRYSVRPVDREDIFVPKKGKSSWKVITGWRLDGSLGSSLFFENAGQVENLTKKGVKEDRVLNDMGAQGFLWTDAGSEIRLTVDLDGVSTEKDGVSQNGALYLWTPSRNWYRFNEFGQMEGTSSIMLEFSSSKVKAGSLMQLAFNMAAGNSYVTGSYNYPYEWKVECSVDGSHWITMKDIVTGLESFALRTMPYKDGKVGKNRYKTQYDAGMGLQQRVFSFPEEALGKPKVMVRITPASRRLSIMHRSSPDLPSGTNRNNDNYVRMDTKEMTYVRIGTMKIEFKDK